MSRVPKSVLQALLGLGAVCLLNGCTALGPDYQEPAVKWLDGWQSDLYGQRSSAKEESEVDLRFWWRLYDDPVLNGLIATARRENPSLRLAGLRVLESRATLGIASSARFPQAQQGSGAVNYVNTQRSGGSTPDSDDSLASYQAGLGLSWELDFWGRFQRGIESADAAFFASISNQRDAQVLLSAQVSDLYFAWHTTKLRIEIAHSNADVQKRSFEITERMFKGGDKSELDLQQAKTQYLATLASIPDLEITLTQTRNALAALLGRAPGDLPELANLKPSLPMVTPAAIRDLPAELLLRRPDIRATAWQIAAQSAQIGLAEADLYPSVSLLGNLGWSGDSRSESANTLSLGIGPSITWNLFDHGLIKNNIRVQDARFQQAVEGFQNAVLNAAREIDDAAIHVVKTCEKEETLAQSVEAANRSLELANTRYHEGYADFQRVLDAQRAAATQSEKELVNKGDHVSAVIDLYKALGGGWVDAAIEELAPETLRTTMESRTDWGDLLNAPLPAMPDHTPLRPEGSEDDK